MVQLLQYVLPLVLSLNLIQSKIISLDWKIEERTIAPDNSEIHGILINGQFPGPTINAVQGDIVKIKVRNLLHKEFTIHWHGIIQTGTSISDGVPYVTQDPIKPGGIYDYYFELGHQSGTHWYHAHTGLDAEHAYGAFIIQDKPETTKSIVKYNPKYKYDEEHVLMLSEMWHKSSEELIEGLVGPDFKFVGPSDSILMNGQVYKNWTNGNADPNMPSNKGNAIINVKPNKTYRLRLIGALGFQKMKFSIPNHKFTVVEADGTLVDPVDVDYVEVFGGQRYSVLFKTDQKPDNYIAYAQRTGEVNKVDFAATAIIHYENAQDCQHMVRAELPKPKPAGNHTRWVEEKLRTSKWYIASKNKHYYPVPKKVTKHIYLRSSPQFVGKHVDELINGLVAPVRNTTLLTELIDGSYKPSPGIYEINEGDVVQIVMEHHLDASKFEECLAHPWHLHGHAFHIVGSGRDEFDPVKDGKRIDDYVNTTKDLPLFRDTFTHFPENTENMANVTSPTFYNRLREATELQRNSRSGGEPKPTFCGWYAIRFVADNPGAWFMHCHISGHLVMGKSIMIVEKPKNHKAFVETYNAKKLRAASL